MDPKPQTPKSAGLRWTCPSGKILDIPKDQDPCALCDDRWGCNFVGYKNKTKLAKTQDPTTLSSPKPLSQNPHRLLHRRAEISNPKTRLIKRRRPLLPSPSFPFPSDELEAKRKQLDGLKKPKKDEFGFWLRLDKILPKLFDPWMFYLLLILIDKLKHQENILRKEGQTKFDGWFSLDQGEIKKVCPFFSKKRLQATRRKLEKAGILVVERKLRIGTTYVKKNRYWIDLHHLCSLIDSLMGDQNE